MANARLSVLLAHLHPSQLADPSPGLPPGSRHGAACWTINPNLSLVIVGGLCLDIQAQPTRDEVQRGTSVPGKVLQVPGGVGRNMAEALSRLVPPARPAPAFVSLVGDDAAGAFLTGTLRKLRLDLAHLITCPGAPTPCVTSVLERGGEVAACVADVSAVEAQLTPSRLIEECGARLQQASLVLAEANLSTEALEAVSGAAARAHVPVFLEPVSVPKAARLARSLPYATFISPNAGELMSIADEVRRAAGRPLLPRPRRPSSLGGEEQQGAAGAEAGAGSPLAELLQQLAAFAEVVLRQGTGHVVLTLGSLGAALIRTCDPPAPRGAPGTTPGSVLPPLELRACACAPGTRRGACTANSSSSSSSHRVGAGCGCAGQTRHGVAVQGLGGGSAAVGSTLAPVPCAGSTGNALARQCHVAGFVRQHPIHCCQPAEVACECGISKGSAAGRVGGDVRGWLGEAWGIGPAGCHASQGLVMRQCSGGEGGGGHRVVAGGRVAECAGVLANDNSSSSGGSRTGSSSFWVEVLHLRALPAEVVSVNGAGDTLVAGMVASLLEQQDPVTALAYGMAAAKRAVESHSNVPQQLELGALRGDAMTVLASLQRYAFPPSPYVAA